MLRRCPIVKIFLLTIGKHAVNFEFVEVRGCLFVSGIRANKLAN